MKALLLIDLQNDLCFGGAIEVPEGDAVIPVANRLIPHFEHVIASRQWHPADHSSFAAMHPWRRPGQVIEIDGQPPQLLWTMHCVQGSFGAEFSPKLHASHINKIIDTGTTAQADNYSAFADADQKIDTGLLDYLQSKEVTALYIMGLPIETSVKNTALQALEFGFDTYVFLDGCRGDITPASEEMAEMGVTMLRFDQWEKYRHQQDKIKLL
ncbi:MAG: bifunctional nicotinamidase/pyrazinamidase [Saprospiraceae bacterium]|nr:bifunctional nicotinamidase/pyrazinamidase [Saprospiraceae bacterium]